MQACLPALALLTVTLTSQVAAGTDPEPRSPDFTRPRTYLGLRGADSNPVTDIHDAWGVSFGRDFSRHLSLELAGDCYEKSFQPSGHPELGEYAVWAFVPQVRLRYPLLHGWLVPYMLGGIGGAFTQFNDRKPHGFGHEIHTDSSAAIGSIGAGLDYFVSQNITLGFEFKYLASTRQHASVDGQSSALFASAPLLMVSIRVHSPELNPAPLLNNDGAPSTRWYFGPRVGGARLIRDSIFPHVRAKPEPSAFSGGFNQLFGFVAGFDADRNWSGEISFEGFETVLDVDGHGPIGEYAVFAILPQVRFRIPQLNGRLVPYGIAGVGLGYSEFNDRKPRGADLKIEGESFGVSASLGAGLEYYLTGNLSLQLESRYLLSRGQSLRIDHEPERDGQLDALLISMGLRVHFGGTRSHPNATAR